MTRLAPDVARAPEHVISVTRDALQRLARDLRWTWHREAASLFRDLDPEAGIAIGPVAVSEEAGSVRVRTELVLGSISTRDVVVQLWIDRGCAGAGPAPRPMQVHSRANGTRGYEVVVDRSSVPPGTKLAVRVLPHHPSVDDPLSTGLVAWSG